MDDLNFWRTWPKTYRLIFYFFSSLVIFLVGLNIWASYLGDDLAISWSKLGNFEILSVVFKTFQDDYFGFPIVVDNYIFVEKFLSNQIDISVFFHILHLFTLGLAIIFVSTAISSFKKIAYFLGLGLLFFFFSSLNLETLGLLTYDRLIYNYPSLNFLPYFDKLLLTLTILIYGLTSYYFKVYAQKTNYLRRLSIFTLYTCILSILIFKYTPHKEPYLYLTGYGTFVPLVVMMIVCLVSGYEMIRGFVFIVTRYNDRLSSKSFWHLLFICVIYFTNLFFLYLSEIRGKDLGFYYLPYTIVLGISVCLAVWGLRMLASYYRSFMDYAPNMLFSYLGLLALALSGLSLAYFNVNDQLLLSYKEIIIYLYMGLSLGFIVYVFSNFNRELLNNRRVYNVLFKPEVVGLPIIWIAALTSIFIYAIFNDKNLFVQHKVWSAYYNNLGLAHYQNGDDAVAKEYYRLAMQRIPENHHASYSLGMMARGEGNELLARHFFERSKYAHPSPHKIIQLADILDRQEEYFKALFLLEEASDKFKYHTQINNNLALLYNRLDIPDSIFKHFKEAQQYNPNSTVLANTFALWVKYDTFSSAILDLYQNNNNIHVVANKLAYMNKWEKYETEQPFLLDFEKDTILDAPTFCYLYNYVYNHIESIDSSFYANILKLTKSYDNLYYAEYLNYIVAIYHYKKQNYKVAFEYLEEAYRCAGQYNSYYPNILGLWYLSLNQYQKSVGYFETALKYGNEKSRPNLAFTLIKLSRIEEALEHWQILSSSQDKAFKVLANRMIKVFDPSLKTDELLKSEELLKLHYLLYKNTNRQDPERKQILESLQNDDLKATVLLNDIKYAENKEAILVLLEKISTYQLSRSIQKDYILAKLFYELDNNLLTTDLLNAAGQLTSEDHKIGWKYYFQAIHHLKKKSYNKAIELLEQTFIFLPFEYRPYLTLINIYRRLNDLDNAYMTALNAVKTNPKNKFLLVAYFRCCLVSNYLSFAEHVLKSLSEYVNKNEYEIYLREYKRALKARSVF